VQQTIAFMTAEDISGTIAFMPASVKALPVTTKKGVSFAVGDPTGSTSDSWKLLNHKRDVYLTNRDGMPGLKLSLHDPSAKKNPNARSWRMAFAKESPEAKRLYAATGDRIWEAWDPPAPQLPNTQIVFRVKFITSELARPPEHRKKWEDVVIVKPAPSGSIVHATLFITQGAFPLRHESGASFPLACLDLGDGRFAQLFVHLDPEEDIQARIARRVAEAWAEAKRVGQVLPSDAVAHFYGHDASGYRFIYGARMNR
jgi:hypothetical protein